MCLWFASLFLFTILRERESLLLKWQSCICPCRHISDKNRTSPACVKAPIVSHHQVRACTVCCRLLLLAPPIPTWNNPIPRTLARGLINAWENQYTKVSLSALVGSYVMPAMNMASVWCLCLRPYKRHTPAAQTKTHTHTCGTGWML